METTTINQSKAQQTVDELLFAHRWTLVRNDLFEEQWATMMFEYGYLFASQFASLFTGRERQVEQELLEAAPEAGQPHNWYWMWWKLKWMQDDWNWVNDKVHLQPITYDHYKTYMINCEILEQDLMNLLETKKFF